MIITLRNREGTLTIECDTYSITPKYTNVWVESFFQVSQILQAWICDGVRVSLIHNEGASWQVGFKTEDIKIET